MASHKSDINVGIKFNADTQQARQQLQQLQNQLDNLMKSTANNTSQMPLNKELKEALNAAAQLKVALQAAVNVDTGNLDLSKFSAQLRQSGVQLQDYAKHFLNLGPEGEKAFMNLTKSIVTAEVPLKRSVKLFDELWTTMKNTARWELSSRVLHGFESALSNAYRYSQDLNKSLTDIRIVTGYGADRMADFAIEANKAAKALSATTDEYAKASLIYFQQGLSDSEVQKRADITVKMANVTRDSAQTVSDQMTAIWNNFADGSKSLEYYADVMTALGAETASSTAEISQGLEKFAAVASTVGLSYEYATAALATITAETRESADVVGTALKTLFARIQGLSLGETLEDGTNLTKYSEALEKVGISIKDQNGELKDMDIILNEMAGVWENLNRDQQVALAQTVAGVRQYNQLIALMSNWGVMQNNLGIVANSSGELQKQQDIYAESWEAARDRVTAALEEIYGKLLDDKFFIELTDTFADIIDSVNNLVDALGGLPGVLSLIGSLSTKIFSSQMATGLQTMVHNFKVFTGSAEAESNTLRESAKSAIHKYYSAGGDTTSPEEIESRVRIQEIDRSYELQQLKNISEERKAYYQTLVDLETQYGETAIAATEAVKKESEALTKLNSSARKDILDSGARAGLTDDQIKENLKDFEDFDNYARQAAISKSNKNKLTQASNIKDENEFIKFLSQNRDILDEKTIQKLENYNTSNDRAKKHDKKYQKADQEKDLKQKAGYYQDLREAIDKKSKSQEKEFDIEKKATEYIKKHNQQGKITVEWLEDYAQQVEKTNDVTENQNETLKNYDDLIKEHNGIIQEGTFSLQGWANGIVGIAGGISDVALGLSSLKGAFDILQNEDLTGWEKFTQILTSVGIAIPSLIGGFGQLTNGIKLINESGKISAATLLATTLGLDTNTAAVGANTKEQIVNVIIKKTGIDITELSANATRKEAIENIKAAAAKSGHTVATTILAGVQAILNGQLAIGLALLAPYAAAILGVVAAVGALVIAYQQAQKNSPEGKLKALTEKAEESQKAADEAKQSYEGLKDTIEGYDGAIQKIEELTKGTKEFKDAVEEANTKARELIETYGIASGFYIDENGIIRFEENVLEDAEQKFEDNKNNKAAADLQNDWAVREEQRIQSVDKEISDYAAAFGTAGLTVTKELNEQNASTLYDFFIKNKDIKTKDENYYKGLGNILGIDYDPKNNSYMSIMLEEFDALQFSDGFVALNSLITNIGNINSDAISEMNSAAALYGTEAGYFEDTKYNNATNVYASNKDVDFTSKYDDWTTSELQAELEKMEYEYSNGKWYYKDQELTNFNRDKQVEALAGRDSNADYQTRVGEFQAYSDSYKLDAKVMEAMSTGNWSNLTEEEYNLLQNPHYWNNNGNIVVGQDVNGEDIIKSRYSFIEEYAKEAGLTIEEFEAEINAAVKDYNDHRLEYTYAALEQEKQAYQKEATEVKSIYDTMFKDGIEGLDEQQLARLDELEAKYSSLAEAGERGSKQYMEALRIIQEANEAYAIGTMMDQEDNLWAQYDEEVDKAEKDTEKIQEILDQIVSTNYEIQLAINADIETDLDNIYNKINQITSAAEKIGEGFTVSADDIREVAEAFPGILKNYKVLANGQIKLDQKVAEAVMDNAQAEIEADKKVALEKIRTQKIEIKSRLTILRKMLEIAKKQAKGEINVEDAKNQMAEASAEYKEELANDELTIDEDLHKEKEENLDEFDKQAKESAEYTYNAFRQGSGASSESHIAFINGAIAAMNEFVAAGNAAAAMQTYNSTAKDVGKAAFNWWSYNGNGSSTSGDYSGKVDTGGSKSFSDFLSKERVNPEDYINEIQGEIDNYEDLLNDLDIQEAELLAQMSGLGGSLDDAGKGDGGGSGSSEEMLDPEDEIERYHENTRQIERLTRALEKVSTAKDRAFGKHRLALIDDEIEATEKLVQQQRALLAETREYLKQDFAEIQQYGFTYDEYGELTNYDEVMKQQIDKYNAAVATGNKAAIEAAKKEYDEFKENMEQYEETLTAYEEAQAQLQEYINQVVDLKLEKITTEVEIKILVNDKELTRLEYLLRKIEYEGKGAADAIALMGRQFEQISEKAKPIQEAIDKIYEQARAEGRGLLEEEVKEIKSFYEDGQISSEEEKRIQEIYNKAAAEDRMLTQAEEEQIQEYKEQLLELNQEVMDIVETIEGKFIEVLDELNGKVEESIGRFATYTGMYQTLSEVITLSGKANSKYGMDMLNALSAKTVANASQAMKANLQNYEAFNKIYLEEQANLERAIQIGEQRLIDYHTERMHEVEMKREASYESMLSSWAEALQAANDLFDTQLNNMIIELKQNIGDIDKLVEIYDRATELKDLYLSGNKSIYELSKLARSVGKDIEDTSNLIAKNKLVGFLEQINKLRAEGVKLSQYDLEYWQAKYELELAEIALQEAQDAKAQVKLTRNTAGGWGYTYVADAEAISEAQQKYEDSMYAMSEVNNQYINDYSDKLIKNRQEMTNALQDLDTSSLTYEEDLAKTRDYYFKQEEYLMAELMKAYERAGVSYSETILGQVYGDASLQDSHNNFISSITRMIEDELIPAYQEFKGMVDNINDSSGTTLENAMGYITDASQTLESEVTDRITDLVSGVKEASDAIWDFQETYGDSIARMLAINEDYYSKTILAYQNFLTETEVDKWLDYYEDMVGPGVVVGTAGTGTAGKGGTAADAVGSNSSAATSWTGDNLSNENSSVFTRSTEGKTKTASSSARDDNVAYLTPDGHYSTKVGIFEWQANYDYDQVKADLEEEGFEVVNVSSTKEGFNKDREALGLPTLATGGYTGSWGSEGKLAVLHEKELVLNKYDTENMLDMVNTLRDIDWRAKLAELWDNIQERFITPIFGGKEQLDQNVHIEASFPGVSDRNEIQEAFNNLINTASQWSNRKIY